MTAELHCHSLCSVDGWATPEEIAEAAAAAGVATLALTDHNCLDGLSRCRARAEALGLRFIDGVEFDADWKDGEYHFVAFGFDPADRRLNELCRKQFRQYEINFARFIPIIERRFGVGEAEMRAALPSRYRGHPAPVLNKWFARSYLFERGFFPDSETATREMSAVATEAEQAFAQPWDWASFEEVRDAVHGAGGVILVAHPAGIRRGDLAGQLAFIAELMAAGLDGFELYHPSNAREPHFDALVAEARRLGCAASGGSDTHLEPARGGIRSVPGSLAPDWVVATIDGALGRRRR
ncbi:MAG TPA: PHP domain-containing protein [Planctomycetota bacterium]|nr:PHP domain-containing protein [Planctomycetota bacterium]